jgi:MFS family permease
LTPDQAGLLGSSGTLGIVLRLLLAGRIADAYGCKRVLVVGITLCSVFTAASAVATNIQELASALRALVAALLTDACTCGLWLVLLSGPPYN